MKKNLEVSMLGTFRMQYGNHSFIIDRKSTTKTNRLLQIILHAGTEGVTREELVGRLWENEEVANPSNGFRAILFRVRKLLKEHFTVRILFSLKITALQNGFCSVRERVRGFL